MITIKEIAGQLGVSATTVSNVINGRTEKMSEETRKKVEMALIENHYVNDTRREEPDRELKLIALDFFLQEKQETVTDPFCASLLEAAVKTAAEYGRYVLSDAPKSEEQILRKLSARNMEGAIVLGCAPEKCRELAKRTAKPVVFIDSGDGEYDNVGLEDYQGAYGITSYLITQGHKKTAYFYDSAGSSTVSSRERRKGFQDAMSEFGLAVEERDFYGLPADKRLRSEILGRFAADLSRTGYTAALFAYDLFASEATGVFFSRGISVPEDISIAGFDDNIYARLNRPMLTTVRQNPREKAEEAVKLLMKRIYGEPVQVNSLHLPTELIVRESVRNIGNKKN